MNRNSIVKVQTSWQQVVDAAPGAGKLFYTNLFAADPSLRALFRGDIDQQAMKLMQMINAAVGMLNDTPRLIPILQQLSRRHVSYQVKDSHYQTVGEALIKTLSQGLGAAFTPDVKAAWLEVYGVMVSVMLDEAHASA